MVRFREEEIYEAKYRIAGCERCRFCLFHIRSGTCDPCLYHVQMGGILAAYVLSCFISGTVVSRQHSERRYLWGLLMGAIYFTILWVVSLIGNRGAFTGVTGILPALALCLLGGMLGGMMQAGRK